MATGWTMRAGRPGHALVALVVLEREISAGRAYANRQPGCVIEASERGRVSERGSASAIDSGDAGDDSILKV